eukprot:m.177292 g.177292  ORF g.177292 m.177292 type:complete len:720 (+) comp25328_c0_seq1:75-2234(+)
MLGHNNNRWCVATLFLLLAFLQTSSVAKAQCSVQAGNENQVLLLSIAQVSEFLVNNTNCKNPESFTLSLSHHETLEATDFKSIETVSGDVSIQVADKAHALEIRFSSLATIDGTLLVSASKSRLDSLQMPALTTVNQNVTVDGERGFIHKLSLGGPNTGVPLSVGGSIFFSSPPDTSKDEHHEEKKHEHIGKGYFFVFLIIALASEIIGKWMKSLANFPLLTGFLVTGILAGPHVLKLLNETEVEELSFVFDICLGYIAFAAGAEMFLEEIRPALQAILKVCVTSVGFGLGLGTLAIYLFAPATNFLKDLDNVEVITLALLGSVILLARSPSSAIAIINEMGARGTFVQISLGVTMTSDVIVVVGFAVFNAIAQAVFDPDKTIEGEFVAVLVGEVTLSCILGRIYTSVLRFILQLESKQASQYCRQKFPYFHKEVWVPYLRGKGALVRGLLVLGAGYTVFVIAEKMKKDADIVIETLLTCMVASFLLINGPDGRTKSGRQIVYRLTLHSSLEAVAQPVYIAFFTAVGLGLNISIIPDVISVALYLFFVRLLLLFIGSFTGGLWAKQPRKHNYLSFLTYVTQAGVALALTEEIEEISPGSEWGEEFSTTLIAVIVIGQLLGPLAMKYAIRAAGAAGPTTHDKGSQNIGSLTVWWWNDDSKFQNEDGIVTTDNAEPVSDATQTDNHLFNSTQTDVNDMRVPPESPRVQETSLNGDLPLSSV